MLAVFVECGPEPCQSPLTLGEAQAVDCQVVHEPHVEEVVRLPTFAHHARRGLLGYAQGPAKGVHVLRQDRFVREVSGHLGEPGQELVHRDRRARRPPLLLELTRQRNLHGQARV